MLNRQGRPSSVGEAGSTVHPTFTGNKALAQVMAHGSDALRAPPPRLYAGGYPLRPVLERVVESLGRHGLLPERGYLQKELPA